MIDLSIFFDIVEKNFSDPLFKTVERWVSGTPKPALTAFTTNMGDTSSSSAAPSADGPRIN